MNSNFTDENHNFRGGWVKHSVRVQQQLCVVHDVPDLEGATAVCDGMWLGGWRAAQPKVSDRTLAEGRFKFFLGCTEWKAGQLQQEVRDTRPPTPPPHPLARLASCRRR